MNNSDSKVQEGNKLIDIFMGRTPSNWSPSHERVDYDNSWSMLMPVVEKIESIQNGLQHFTVVIEKDKCQILERKGNTVERAKFLHHTVKWITGATKIDAVWQAVIQFIHWYNTNNKDGK